MKNPRSGRPRVLHVVVAGTISGAERFLISLATRSESSGADHCIALMTPNPALRKLFVDAGLKVRDRGPVQEHPVAYLWRAFGPADVAWLVQVIAEEGADLLHLHTFRSHTLGVRAARRSGVPVMRTEHGIAHFRDPSCALFRAWTLRKTDRIIAVSDFVRRVVVAFAPDAEARTPVILNGVDFTHFGAEAPPNEGPFAFVVTGRLEREKQVDVAIEAIARIPGVRLNIVGDGTQQEKLKSLAVRLGVQDRVKFHGFLQDSRPVIAKSDAVINSSRAEACSIALLEAAAMQRPAVAFGAGGTPQIVRDRHTGWLTKENTIEALARSIEEASANRSRAAEYGVNARRWVVSRLGIDEMCRNYAGIYRELTESRGRHASA